MLDWLCGWFRAKRAARRLNLKDLGRVPSWYVADQEMKTVQKVGMACATCCSKMRLGSASEGRVFHYCWKCSKIVNSGNINEGISVAGQNILRITYDDDTRAGLESLRQDCQLNDIVGVISKAIALWREAVETTKAGKRLCITTYDLSDNSPIDSLALGKWIYVPDEGRRLKAPEEKEK